MEKEYKILLVDDVADFRQLMRFWLESKGYRIMEASNGERALEMVKGVSPPDMVFLDLNMPGMDGVDTLKEIRKNNKTLPVIIISAYVHDPRADEASSLGVSGVFYKGMDYKEIMPLLETALRTHKKIK